MVWGKREWTDRQVELIIGNLLRFGVIAAAIVVSIGGVLYLEKHFWDHPGFRTFHGEPADLRGLRGLAKEAFSFTGRGVIQLGIILLISIPVGRVAFSILAFSMQRDFLYVLVTSLVFVVLVASIFGLFGT